MCPSATRSPFDLGKLLSTGGRLLCLERLARATSLLEAKAILATEQVDPSEVSDRVIDAVLGRRRGLPCFGLGDDTSELARSAGWPTEEEFEVFAASVERCPTDVALELLRVGRSARRKSGFALGVCSPLLLATARYVLAHRLIVLLASDPRGNPDFDSAIEMLTEEVCWEHAPGAWSGDDRLNETALGGALIQVVRDILVRVALDKQPPYLAEALRLPPVHAYHTLRKRLRDYELLLGNGRLAAALRTVQVASLDPSTREESSRSEHRRRDYLSAERLRPMVASSDAQLRASAAAARLPRHLWPKVRKVAESYFAALPEKSKQVLVLKALGFGGDDSVGAALGFARETVNRLLGDLAAGWPLWARKHLASTDFEVLQQASEEQLLWLDMVPSFKWPVLPASALRQVLPQLTLGYEFVREWTLTDEAGPAALEILEQYCGERNDGFLDRMYSLLERHRAAVSAYKSRVLPSAPQAEARTSSPLDAQFLFVFAGFLGLGYGFEHVNAGVRIYASLDADERWLLANASAPRKVAEDRFGGKAALDKLRVSLRDKCAPVEQEVFPGVDYHQVTMQHPDAGHYPGVTGHTVDPAHRALELEQVFNVLSFLARKSWVPY